MVSTSSIIIVKNSYNRQCDKVVVVEVVVALAAGNNNNDNEKHFVFRQKFLEPSCYHGIVFITHITCFTFEMKVMTTKSIRNIMRLCLLKDIKKKQV